MLKPMQRSQDRLVKNICGVGRCGPAWVLAAALCLTHVLEARADANEGYNPRVCVGLYAWVQNRAQKGTNLWKDLDAVLGEVREAGFRAVEGFLQDFFGSDERAERARQLLAKHKIVLAGAYTGGKLYEEAAGRKTVAAIVEMARRTKPFPNIFIDINPDPLPGGKKKTDKQLATQVRLLNQLGKKLSEIGIELVIHQHAPEIHHGAREHRYNVAHVDPAVVGFCIDTHWFYRGGEDPLALTKETGRKIKAVHLRNSKDGIWTESFGPGDVDYAAIAKYLREIEFAGWLSLELAVEKGTKVTRSIAENHRLGREYLESVFLDKASTGRSRFGGWKAQRTTPIGWFYTDRIDGRWWLIDPDGYPFVSKGVCHVSYVADHCPALGYTPYGRATEKKYGSINKFAAAAAKRLQDWGYNTVGAWSNGELFEQDMPYTVILGLAAKAGASWQHGGFPDVFSDSFRRKVEAEAEAHCAPRAGDPYLLGYFTDNELWWGSDPRGMQTLLECFLAMPADAAGKKAAVDFLLKKYKDVAALDQAWDSQFGSREKLLRTTKRRLSLNAAGKADAADFLQLVARQYFQVCRDAIRQYDPYHLILGCRFAGPPPPEVLAALKVAGKLNVLESYVDMADEIDHFWFERGGAENLLKSARGLVDVLSVNYYGLVPDKDLLDRAHQLSEAPILVSEFGFKAMDSGLPNTKGAGLPVATQADRARSFTSYVSALLTLPYAVGYHWFEHADEPAQGRFDGENCNYGLVNIRDEPWELLVKKMTEVNESIEARHAGAE